MNSVSTLVASCSGLAVSAVGLAICRQDTPSQQRSISPSLGQSRSVSAPLDPQTPLLLRPDPRLSIDSTSSQDSSFGLSTLAKRSTLSELARPSPPIQSSATSRLDMARVAPSPAFRSTAWAKDDAHASESFHAPRFSPDMEPHDQTPPGRGYFQLSQSRQRPAASSTRPASFILRSRKRDSTRYDQGITDSEATSNPSRLSRAGSISKLPLPILRRTSKYQARNVIDPSSGEPKDSNNRTPNLDEMQHVRWRNFFTPTLTPSPTATRSSTHIPNPIKRVRPDRQHRPVLVSAAEQILPSSIHDISHDGPQAGQNVSESTPARRFFSAPLPQDRPMSRSSRLSLHFTPAPNEPLLRKKSHRRYSHFDLGPGVGHADVRPDEDVESVPRPTTSGSLSKRSSFLSSLRQISHNRVSSAPSNRKPAQKTPGRDFSAPITHPRTRQSETPKTVIQYSKKRQSIDRTLVRPSGSRDGGYVLRPSSASTATSSIRDFSHTPTIDSILQPSRPGSAAGHSFEPNFDPALICQPRELRSLSSVGSSVAESDLYGGSRDDDYGFSSADDALYDSVRTRATSTSSALRATDIEKMFVPPDECANESTPTQLGGQSWLLSEKSRHSVIEEEESNASTPIRNRNLGPVRNQDSCLSLGRNNPLQPGDDNETWSTHERCAPGPTDTRLTLPVQTQPLRLSGDTRPSFGSEARSNIFDWAEHRPLDSGSSIELIRPKTVHGKKATDPRGGRSSGRHSAVGVHVRSQSVPVAQEIDGKRSQVVTNKFGTWGVGSKGVTEDWNEDFDFDFSPQARNAVAILETQDEETERLDSAKGMVIPDRIQEQQSSVLANIGLLRDWGLLIEELKELRARAVQIKVVRESRSMMWHEVDAMIDLADQESQDHTIAPGHSGPPSPDFNAAAFDEPIPTDLSLLSAHTTDKQVILESPSSSTSPVKTAARLTGRPRKDSEAVARSVIEALQQKRNVSDPTSTNVSVVRPSKKVPFDTTTLRRIVPHVQELRDQVKQTIREAERLDDHSPTPHQQWGQHDDHENGPVFSRIFQQTRPTQGSSSASSSPAGKITSGQRSVASEQCGAEEEQGRPSCSSPEGLEAGFGLMAMV